MTSNDGDGFVMLETLARFSMAVGELVGVVDRIVGGCVELPDDGGFVPVHIGDVELLEHHADAVRRVLWPEGESETKRDE